MPQDKISHLDQQVSNEIKDDLSITFLQTTDSSKLSKEETNQTNDQLEKEIRSNLVKPEISKSLNQEEINQKIHEFENEIRKNPIKLETVRFEKHHNGITQYLKSKEENPFSVSSSSSFYSLFKPENIFHYNDLCWFSNDESNSWILITFTSKKILLSGYLFRSFYDASYSNPKSWKVERSNDEESWTLIDQQIDCNWINQDYSEMYFPVESNEHFRYFKFTQTGKNYQNHHHFLLNFVELFGDIFEQ
jgi:hypothetical protein